MKKQIVLTLIVLMLTLVACVSAEGEIIGNPNIIGSKELSISLLGLEHGVALSQIESNGKKLLNKNSYLFELNILNTTDNKESKINSLSNWAMRSMQKNSNVMTVRFSEPLTGDFPKDLEVVVSIKLNGSKSSWDYKVSGLGNKHSLMNAITTKLSLKAMSNDNFFIPRYSGKLLPNPLANNADYKLRYPRGWSTTMQYLAYYGNDLGMYFGFHDPKASVKQFFVKAEEGSIDFWSEVTIADKTQAANDWDFPGVFELDIFKGDWFDAAQIYKIWASSKADYWPKMTAERIKRQNTMGQIGIWSYYAADKKYPIEKIEKGMQDYIDFFADVPVGIHWYKWNYLEHDDNYPDYFPERAGMKELIAKLQTNKDVVVMPYINGRLFDTDLSNYRAAGLPYATKDIDGHEYTQDFNGNHFAVMCPSQRPWQRTIADVAKRLTGTLGSKAIYIDQVAAASPLDCMDKSHGHSLGGGSWWHDGYDEMFKAVRDGISDGKFVTVEGANDYLANIVDGFLTQGWVSDNLVPAFQAVYSGKVQLFGKRTGTSEYRKPSYYAKFAQAFVTGIQPGRTSNWIVHDPNAEVARPFVKQLATMRYKLKSFLAFGSLQRPIDLSGNIPQIVSTWKEYGKPIEVGISAVQSSVYKNKAGDKIAFIFVNASMDKTIDFSFVADGGLYGLNGKLEMQRITSAKDYEPVAVNNRASHAVKMEPLEVVAFVFARDD